MSDDWRFDGEIGADAGDYFLGQRKRLDIDKRRPVIRRASDIVGPGIGPSAVRVTNWNDILATFNGYYSSLPGAGGAPNSVENFVGFTVMDDTMGGTQRLTGMASNVEYRRVFLRNPSDSSSITWGNWILVGTSGVAIQPATATTPAGSTSGTAFSTPAGVLTGVCNCMGLSSGNGGLGAYIYLDGVLLGAMGVDPISSPNVWQALSTVPIRAVVTAGTHYLYYRLVTGDGLTRTSFMGTVSPG